MNVTVSAKEFAPACAQAARICATVTTLPILKNILLEVSCGQLRVAATDLESTLDIRLPSTGGEIADGSVTVSAKSLAELVGSLGGSDVKLESVVSGEWAGHLCITSKSGEYRLAGLRPEDFPAITNPSETNPVTLDAALLRDTLMQIVPYPDPQDTRVAFKSVRFLGTPGKLLLAGVTASQYSRRLLAVPDCKGGFEALVPVSATREVMELLKRGGECRICSDTNQFSIYAGDIVFSTRVFEGTAGDTAERRCVASSSPHTISVSRDELAAAMKRLLVYAPEKAAVHPVELTFTADEATLACRTDKGSIRETLALTGCEGEPADYWINAFHVQQAIQVLRAETVELHFGVNALSPMFIRTPHDAEQQIWMAPPNPDFRG